MPVRTLWSLPFAAPFSARLRQVSDQRLPESLLFFAVILRFIHRFFSFHF